MLEAAHIKPYAGHVAARPSREFLGVFAQAFKKHGLPVDVAKENRNKVNIKRAAVRLLSMHTAKGLEFPCVAVSGLGAVGRHGETTEECVRLVYVAITRATHEVLLTYSQESEVVGRLAG